MKNISKKILSGVLAAGVALSLLAPFGTTAAYAAQSNEYTDPADVWISANNRTNEFDINATTTYETNYCPVCEIGTSFLTFRVPEYTRSGETALNHGVAYSDGTLIDGAGKGNADSGTPGVDAAYTGYHYTKTVCQKCGTINATNGRGDYSFNKNVYSLNPCDSNFFLPFDNTTYEQYNGTYHKKIEKEGEYCQYCKGTYAKAKEKQERHNLGNTVISELGNQRFHIVGDCDDCGYIENDYVAAKAVVQSYYGKVDGEAHSITLTDLSESGVNTSIRYGTAADKCTKTSAPSYTNEGYYPVYYEITYSYDGESMIEDGVSYVWLLSAENSAATVSSVHTHDFRYLETVKPTCTELGYERWQCSECGALEKRNYTPASGHSYDTVTIREASCTQGGLVLHLCKDCGDFYTETTPTIGHDYEKHTVPATCTKAGYTQYKCKNCGHSYITDITGLAAHSYAAEVTEQTCTAKGFTTHTCTVCGDTYISDYTEPTGHDWDEGHTVTVSTCDGEGVIEYHCKNCDEKMIKATSAKGHTAGAPATCTEPQICTDCGAILELPTGHHYHTTVFEPTCTTMGYTVYECDEGDHSYIADYTDKIPHNYKTSVTAPTCTEMGFTTYTCEDCGDSYISDYTDKLPHEYKAAVTKPTCTEMGFTTYTCGVCGDSYIGDYKDAHGHSYKAAVTEPTCTEIGYTDYTCDVCGDTYRADETAKLPHSYTKTVTEPTCTELGYTTYVCDDCGDTHRSDYIEAAGHKPSDWIIDTPATIENAGEKHIECTVCGEVLKTAAIPQLADKDNSDEDGNSKVGDYDILITDKDGKPVFNSEISIDLADNITIKLPADRLLSADDITTVTVTKNQQPVKDLFIFIADTNGNGATGNTDDNGQLSVPNANSSTGDTNGTVTDDTNTYVVIATDKNGVLIPDCEVIAGDNYSIDVKLPDGTAFDKDNRVTITVVNENGEPVKSLRVQVIGDGDYIENGNTNVKGQVALPMTNTDITDDKGNAEVGEVKDDKIYDYIVTVSDENGLVKNALITLVAEDNSVLVCLPDGKVIDYYNRTTIKVTKSDGTPVPDWKVTAYNKDGSGIRTELTDEDGIVIVPPLSEAPIARPTPTPTPNTEATPLPGTIETPKPDNTAEPAETDTPTETAEPSETNTPAETAAPTETDKPDIIPTQPTPIPDIDGAVVENKDYKYRVYVWDKDGAITDFGLIKLNSDGSVNIELPDSKTLTADNKTYIRIVSEENGGSVKGVTVNVTDNAGNSASDKTNSNGIAVVPVSDGDFTDADGNATITDADGKTFNVNVADTSGNIENAYVKTADGKISVTLPDGKVLKTDNQTTVTVTDKENTPISNMSVTVTDNKNNSATKPTDANGKITVPIKTSSGGGGGSSSGGSRSGGGGGGGSSAVKTTYVVTVTDKDGKPVTVSKIEKDGTLTLALPSGKLIDADGYYTIVVKDSKGNVKPDIYVTVKDKKNTEARGKTDADGKLVIPSTVHNAYVYGYEDGEFKPEGNMTRAEAAAIFARNIAERKGEVIPDKKSEFTDVNSKLWYSSPIAYLAKYEVISGYSDGTFKPEEQITRAEFVSMVTRFYDLFNTVSSSGKNGFTDVAKSHWAYKYINSAASMNWIAGYADGTFRPDNNIKRAEVVAIVNRVTDRAADKDYINKNLSAVNSFADLKDKTYWAFYDIIEAANTHSLVSTASGEMWVK